VALGSNIGDRFRAIEDACISIDSDDDMRIVETSPLYETAPMYVEDQGNFLNGVCKVGLT
jgi:2-amino-4-hydroxy-6-hydroxymethyldihydropteridine diphosphokinase/dihydropteroate synthase